MARGTMGFRGALSAGVVLLLCMFMAPAAAQSCKADCLNPGSSCDTWVESAGMDCAVLEKAGCDCSNCARCLPQQSTSAASTTSATASSSTFSTPALSSASSGGTQVTSPYGVAAETPKMPAAVIPSTSTPAATSATSVAAVSPPPPAQMCPKTCMNSGLSCDDFVKQNGLSCIELEKANCDCRGCSLCEAQATSSAQSPEVPPIPAAPAVASAAAQLPVDSSTCAKGCLQLDKTCNDHVLEGGVKCALLTAAGCDCDGCSLCEAPEGSTATAQSAMAGSGALPASLSSPAQTPDTGILGSGNAQALTGTPGSTPSGSTGTNDTPASNTPVASSLDPLPGQGSTLPGQGNSPLMPENDASCAKNCLTPGKTCNDFVKENGMTCAALAIAGCDCTGCSLCEAAVASAGIGQQSAEATSGSATPPLPLPQTQTAAGTGSAVTGGTPSAAGVPQQAAAATSAASLTQATQTQATADTCAKGCLGDEKTCNDHVRDNGMYCTVLASVGCDCSGCSLCEPPSPSFSSDNVPVDTQSGASMSSVNSVSSVSSASSSQAMAAGSPLVSADSTTTATGTPGLPIAPEPASATALQGSASEASESSCAVGCLGQDKSCNDFVKEFGMTCLDLSAAGCDCSGCSSCGSSSAGSTAGADTSFSAAAGANAGANTVANIGVTDGTGTGGSQAFSIGNAEVPQSASAQSEYAATTTTSSGSTSSAAGLTAGVETSSMGSNSAPQEVFASTPSTCKLGCLADDKTCNDYVRDNQLPCEALEKAGCDCTGCSLCAASPSSTTTAAASGSASSVFPATTEEEPDLTAQTAGLGGAVEPLTSTKTSTETSTETSPVCAKTCLGSGKSCDDFVKESGMKCEDLAAAGCDCSGCGLCEGFGTPSTAAGSFSTVPLQQGSSLGVAGENDVTAASSQEPNAFSSGQFMSSGGASESTAATEGNMLSNGAQAVGSNSPPGFYSGTTTTGFSQTAAASQTEDAPTCAKNCLVPEKTCNDQVLQNNFACEALTSLGCDCTGCDRCEGGDKETRQELSQMSPMAPEEPSGAFPILKADPSQDEDEDEEDEDEDEDEAADEDEDEDEDDEDEDEGDVSDNAGMAALFPGLSQSPGDSSVGAESDWVGAAPRAPDFVPLSEEAQEGIDVFPETSVDCRAGSTCSQCLQLNSKGGSCEWSISFGLCQESEIATTMCSDESDSVASLTGASAGGEAANSAGNGDDDDVEDEGFASYFMNPLSVGVFLVPVLLIAGYFAKMSMGSSPSPSRQYGVAPDRGSEEQAQRLVDGRGDPVAALVDEENQDDESWDDDDWETEDAGGQHGKDPSRSSAPSTGYSSATEQTRPPAAKPTNRVADVNKSADELFASLGMEAKPTFRSESVPPQATSSAVNFASEEDLDSAATWWADGDDEQL